MFSHFLSQSVDKFRVQSLICKRERNAFDQLPFAALNIEYMNINRFECVFYFGRLRARVLACPLVPFLYSAYNDYVIVFNKVIAEFYQVVAKEHYVESASIIFYCYFAIVFPCLASALNGINNYTADVYSPAFVWVRVDFLVRINFFSCGVAHLFVEKFIIIKRMFRQIHPDELFLPFEFIS